METLIAYATAPRPGWCVNPRDRFDNGRVCRVIRVGRIAAEGPGSLLTCNDIAYSVLESKGPLNQGLAPKYEVLTAKEALPRECSSSVAPTNRYLP